MTPIGNTVRLINHQQGGPFSDFRQHLVTEPFIGQPFGRNEQDIHFITMDRFFNPLPVSLIVGVDRRSVNPHPLCGRDLVPHQRKQWGDEKRGTLSGFTQEFGRNEVNNALAPTGFLDNEKATASFYEMANSLFLALTEGCIGPIGAGLQ